MKSLFNIIAWVLAIILSVPLIIVGFVYNMTNNLIEKTLFILDKIFKDIIL